MCGIAGILIKKKSDISLTGNNIIARMSEAMRPRGPDYGGIWENEDNNVYFGHRRLSIIDVDARSNQPLISVCGQYVIVFNGEIYNYKELREELLGNGVNFNTFSDTEVILNLYIKYGSGMLAKLRGMFAFAIWDGIRKICFLARDPYGIKPLYIGRTNGAWLFASQVKTLYASNLIAERWDFSAIENFWMLGSIPGPATVFQEISEILPGSWVELNQFSESITTVNYWNIGDSWCVSKKYVSPNSIQKLVRNALVESVRYHLISDCPIAILLSGGIDSCALLGLMVECGANNLTAITIAYEEYSGSKNDESVIAERIAKYYGVKHIIRKVDKNEFEKDLPLIISSMDQPTIDGINVWFASKAVAEAGFKVVLSGIGGDELFLGYDSFRQIPILMNLVSYISKLPGGNFLMSIIFALNAKRTNTPRWNYASKWLKTVYGGWWLRRSTCAPNELQKKMEVQTLASYEPKVFSPVNFLSQRVGVLPENRTCALAQIESMMYLRNQLLRDSDWASMAHGVELRTPLVDAHLLRKLEPLIGHFHNFANKCLLANAPIKKVPSFITKRKKTGFSIPVKQWINSAGIGSSECAPTWQELVISKYMTKHHF